MRKVVIIGSGNVAQALAVAVARCEGWELSAVVARNAERGGAIAQQCDVECSPLSEELPKADIYLLSVSDSAIGQVASQLRPPKDSIVAHTAGSVALEVLPDMIARRGVLYPLQSFSKGFDVAFDNIPIFIEGEDSKTEQELTLLARELSRNVESLSSEKRAQLHLAAVFACNFTNHMYAISESIISSAGGSFEHLKPLIEMTAKRACATRSPKDCQTGPAVRGDATTISRQLNMLSEEPKLQNIYSKISDSIWETSKKI